MARILVIDDDPQVRGMVRRILERAGHAVSDAADGAAGIRAHRAQPAELIITDIFMPGQDGLETILALRSEFPGVRIIVISGGDRSGVLDLRKEARMLGAARALGKPFTPADLIGAVDALLAEPAS